MPGRNAKSKRVSELMNAFESSKSAKEMLKAFHKLEKTCNDESRLGMAAWHLAHQLNKEGKDPEKLLCFGKRALKTLIDNTECMRTKELCTEKSFVVANLLTMLGLACFELRRFDESLSYLNWRDRNLRKLELDKSVPDELVVPELLVTQMHLYMVKVVMGRKEEVIVHVKKILEIKEKILEEGCMELGKDYEHFADGCVGVDDYKEALPVCLKAVEIHAKHLGQDSVEVARLRRKLGVIYSGLGEYEKAIEQNELAQSVLKRDAGSGDVLIKARIESGGMLVRLGRYQEALDVLKGVVSDAGDSESQVAIAYVSMAKAYCGLEKFVDAKKYVKLALGLFDKEGMDPDVVATGVEDMLKLVEELNDVGIFVSVLLIKLKTSKIPQEILKEYSTRHARLTEWMRKEKEVEGQGPSEEDKLDEAFALLMLVKENTGGLAGKSPTWASPENFFAENAESIISKARKLSSSH